MKTLLETILENKRNKTHFINKLNIEQFIDDLFELLFTKEPQSIQTLELEIKDLEKRLLLIIDNVLNDLEKSTEKVTSFFNDLKRQYKLLLEDAMFILNNDPAAKILEAIYVAYPGFFAIAVYRFAHQLFLLDVPLIPRVFTELAHSKTGIDIHPGASIGKQFFIDHGTGIVIGETAQIGDNVKIYQGVTLGAISVSKSKEGEKRHPTIENNVVIYSGATILGGDTIVGNNSVVGGNVWLTRSIEPYSKVFHKSQIIVKGKKIKKEPINFVI